VEGHDRGILKKTSGLQSPADRASLDRTLFMASAASLAAASDACRLTISPVERSTTTNWDGTQDERPCHM
jgi:hypothetical protein